MVTFKFVGGALCLDFINTVAGRDGTKPLGEKFQSLADLARWSRQAGLKNASPPALARAVRFREALFRIFDRCAAGHAPLRADLAALNRELIPEILRYRRGAFQIRDDAPMLASIARSAANLLTSADLLRVRRCDAGDCGWMFLDTSRNHSRRWCQMRICGNRAKAKNFRKTHAA